MKNFTVILLLQLSSQLNAQVSGSVFRDYNANGVKNNSASFNEPFVSGITVNAYNTAGTLIATTTTAGTTAPNFSFPASGGNSIASGTMVRLEFVGLNSSDYPSFNGTGNGTHVQFVTAPSTTANFAVNNPEHHWNNTSQPNPKILTPVYAHGDINHNNATGTSFGIVQIDNNTNGHNPTIVNVATQAQVGSVWGVGFQKTHNRYFFGNFLKRHVGMGPKGVGGVYMTELSGSNYTLTGSFTLQGVTPNNGGGALDMGSVTRVSTPTTSDNYLATGSSAQGRDMDAFAKVGKIGFGDIDVDDNNQLLFLVNLNQRKLITLNITGGTSVLNNATAATLGPLTNAYDILSLPGVPSCTSGQLRPFALKIYNGRGYLGVVCDASSTPRDSSNLAGFILSFNPTNIAAGFTTELTISFNYRTSTNNGSTNKWHSWADTWSNVIYASFPRYPEPMISDIEFDENGGMNIAIMDRFGHQTGVAQPIPVAGSATNVTGRVSGDLLHACRSGSTWVMEAASGACTPANIQANADGIGDGPVVAVYEYYDDQSGDGVGEASTGAMAKLMGSYRLVQTMEDPIPSAGTSGQPYWFSGGMHWYDVSTGGWSQYATLFDADDAGFTGSFEKANGMGDIEFAVSPQPIQIGNRIWLDANANGVQDAGETTPGVTSGTTVTLRSPGVNGIFGDGDDQTWTTTTDAAGNFYFSALSSADNRKPASWAGVSNVILPGYQYRVEVGIPSGKSVTPTDAGSNDNIDNDATTSGGNAILVFTTSVTNHSYDIGIKNGVLPVQRLDVTATLRNTTVTINWTTENEINTAKFVVERSFDNSNFVPVGEKTAAGTFAGISKYSLNDDIAAVVNNAVIYYRIKQIDADGRFAYSKVVVVRPGTKGEVKVWPNPFEDKLAITLTSNSAGKVQVRLMDDVGKTVTSNSYSVVRGSNQLVLTNLNKLAKGIYMVQVTDETGNISFTQKITRQ